MTTESETSQQTQLNMYTTISEACSFLWLHQKTLFLWVCVCAGFSYYLQAIAEIFINEFLLIMGIWNDIATYLLVTIPQALIFVAFSVFCHQLYLLENPRVKGWSTLRLTRVEFEFFGWWIKILGLSLIIFIPVLILISALMQGFLEQNGEGKSWFQYFFALLSVAPILYMFSRFSLVLPAAAVGLKPTLNRAWEQSKENGWRLFILLGVLPALLSSIYAENTSSELQFIPWWVGLMAFLLLYLCSAIEVFILSIAFKKITRWST